MLTHRAAAKEISNNPKAPFAANVFFFFFLFDDDERDDDDDDPDMPAN